MNEELSAFESIIEFSIGLGGFSAIVSVFLHRAGGLAVVDKTRILNLLFMSLLPSFAAFLTIGIAIAEDSRLAYRFGSGFFSLTLFFLMFVAVRGRMSVESSARRELMPTVVFVSMSAVVVSNMIAQGIAAAGFFAQNVFIVLYVGLVISLAQGVVQFIRIIVARPTGNVGTS